MTEIIIAGVVILAVLGAITTLALLLNSSNGGREAARVLASSSAGELVRANESIERLKKDLKSEQERADALDDELAKAADHPDPVGARDRVLARWQAEHAAARGRTIQVPAPTPAAGAGSDELLKPGD